MTKYRVEMSRQMPQAAICYVDAKNELDAIDLAFDIDMADGLIGDGGLVWHDDGEPHSISVESAVPSEIVDRRTPETKRRHDALWEEYGNGGEL